jgi:hypothetical protein
VEFSIPHERAPNAPHYLLFGVEKKKLHIETEKEQQEF